jgi:hypothetical protein
VSHLVHRRNATTHRPAQRPLAERYHASRQRAAAREVSREREHRPLMRKAPSARERTVTE